MSNNQDQLEPEVEKLSLEEVKELWACQQSELGAIRVTLQAQEKKLSEMYLAMSEMSLFMVNMSLTTGDLKGILAADSADTKDVGCGRTEIPGIVDVSCGTDRPATVDVACATVRSCMVPGSWSPGPQVKLDPVERNRRMIEKLCLYYGDPNHMVASCPDRFI